MNWFNFSPPLDKVEKYIIIFATLAALSVLLSAWLEV